jgi:hypothetical protein
VGGLARGAASNVLDRWSVYAVCSVNVLYRDVCMVRTDDESSLDHCAEYLDECSRVDSLKVATSYSSGDLSPAVEALVINHCCGVGRLVSFEVGLHVACVYVS